MNESVVLEKIGTIWPEIALGIGACLCLVTGLHPARAVRRVTPWLAGAALVAAAAIAWPARPADPPVPGVGAFAPFVKIAVALVGLVLLLLAAGVPERLRTARAVEHGETAFDPARLMGGEFYAFFLFSLAGAMLAAGASDLVWMFLALELTSLPTYVMVTVARDRMPAQEAGVKYFFLGAMAAAIFLYGFALIYGATGTTELAAIREYAGREASPLLIAGLMLAVLGIGFKIAAVPMHFYAADVYQGTHVAVTSFLAFVPKTAGFVALALLLATVGWPLPTALVWLLGVMAVLTMTVGNTLGLMQQNVKRALAYSSIAHSGYLLVGLAAGVAAGGSRALENGIAAILFYLVAYGLATTASFAVLGCLDADGEEAQTYDDIAGLTRHHPGLAAVMLVSMISLIGLPPLVGFVGKVYVFSAAIERGLITLVVIGLLNSAVSAVYYLRIVGTCYFGDPADHVSATSAPARRTGAVIAAVAVVILGISGGWLVDASWRAAQPAASAEKAPTVEDDPAAGVARKPDAP